MGGVRFLLRAGKRPASDRLSSLRGGHSQLALPTAAKAGLCALSGGCELRRADRARPLILFRLVRGQLPEPRQHGRLYVYDPRTARAVPRIGQSEPIAIRRAVHQALPVEPRVRQAHLRADADSVARTQRQRATRDRHTRFRRRHYFPWREQHSKRRQHGHRQAPVCERELAQRSDGQRPALPPEPHPHKPQHCQPSFPRRHHLLPHVRPARRIPERSGLHPEPADAP